MKIWVITLFPEMFDGFCQSGVIGQTLQGLRATQEDATIELVPVQLRDHSPKNFKGVDDSPYGGGAGMVIRADVLLHALINGVVAPGNYGDDYREKLHIIFPSPHGKTWEHNYCRDFASRHYNVDSKQRKDLVFICGRYEGIDQRFIDLYVDEMISLGDFILTGGELAVMAILDSSLRFHSGVLGNKESAESESFAGEEKLLEYPQYTRPREFERQLVPDVLTSGNHREIEKWRQAKSREFSTKRKLLDDKE